MTPTTLSVGEQLAANLIDQLDTILREAEEASQPLELDPHRGRLFELFVTAEAAGFTADDAEPDLSADGLCRTLSERWGLRDAAQSAITENNKLTDAPLAKMRLLWSLMRMWMEWTYAWERWGEFHAGDGG